jgi:multidrug transporter EmrE-like cation transporter
VAGVHVADYATLAIAGLVGSVAYGLSLVLFILALRHIGTARTGAYFSIAPFVGAAIAVLLFGEPFIVILMIAAGLMVLGVWLHLTERHDHNTSTNKSSMNTGTCTMSITFIGTRRLVQSMSRIPIGTDTIRSSTGTRIIQTRIIGMIMHTECGASFGIKVVRKALSCAIVEIRVADSATG